MGLGCLLKGCCATSHGQEPNRTGKVLLRPQLRLAPILLGLDCVPHMVVRPTRFETCFKATWQQVWCWREGVSIGTTEAGKSQRICQSSGIQEESLGELVFRNQLCRPGCRPQQGSCRSSPGLMGHTQSLWTAPPDLLAQSVGIARDSLPDSEDLSRWLGSGGR